MGLFGGSKNNDDKSRIVDEGKLHLRKEELDIAKNKVRTGEVMLSKEIIEERKSVDVPVTHEEVIIERRALDHEPSDSPITAEGSIHIPVSEEQVYVDKHTVLTGEVSAYKREVQENKHVDETLRREEVRVDKEGNPIIASDDKHLH